MSGIAEIDRAAFPTLPYPGFATDLQPQMMAMLATAEGTSIATENVFERRFMFVDELTRQEIDERAGRMRMPARNDGDPRGKRPGERRQGVGELDGAAQEPVDCRCQAPLGILRRSIRA